MRMLFTFVGGGGHLDPLLPIADAARAAGHEVAIAGAGGMAASIEAAGFRAFATKAAQPTRLRQPGSRPPRAADREGDERDLRDRIAGVLARRYTELMPAIIREWRPDVLVREEADLGTAIVAELLGLPCVTVIILGAGGYLRKEVVGAPLSRLRSELGLPEDPELKMLDRHLTLSPFPPSFRDPGFPLPYPAFRYRTATVAPARRDSRVPTVYFTLGTAFVNVELFSRVLAGLRDLSANIVMTVGPDTDPAAFGRQPGKVRIERFIPQGEVLARSDLAVLHGGSGSLLGALAHGLPTILLPMGADHPHNAKRCAGLGFGQVLDPVTVTPDGIREAARAVLSEHGYRAAAERIRDEIHALPPAAETIALIERLC
jgi:UDP:flavonoid glycosyltransferase YjiC (YdhE family)